MMKQTILAFVLTLTTAIAGFALAADLEQVKRDGLAGERADGYLGLVKEGVSQEVADLVKSINSKRRAEYERIAGSNDLTMEQVQALAGKKAIERTGSGGWVMQNGGWQQK